MVTRETWHFAALRAAVVEGRTVGVGQYSNVDGETRFMVHDAATGELSGSERVHEDWVQLDPGAHMSTGAVDGAVYAVVHGRGSAYRVDRLTLGGPVKVGWFLPDAVYVSAVTTGWVGDRPAVFTRDGPDVRAYGLLTGEPLGRGWRAPAGWDVDTLVRAGRRGYACLSASDPSSDRRYWLWDAATGVPVRPPMRVRGLRSGPWDLAGRPAVLETAWAENRPAGRYAVWDLALGERAGVPVRADGRLDAPCVGTLHGRPVLGAATDTRVRVWDLLTGRLIHAGEVPGPPLAMAIGRGGLIVADAHATIAWVPVPLRAAHPLADR